MAIVVKVKISKFKRFKSIKAVLRTWSLMTNKILNLRTYPSKNFCLIPSKKRDLPQINKVTPREMKIAFKSQSRLKNLKMINPGIITTTFSSTKINKSEFRKSLKV